MRINKREGERGREGAKGKDRERERKRKEKDRELGRPTEIE